MINQGKLLFILPLLIVLTSTGIFAKDYVIYSIAHELPLKNDVTNTKKNFYVNMGAGQGLKNGTTLDVYRNIFQTDPLNNNKRHIYKVKVGLLEVLHTEDGEAIAYKKEFLNNEKSPVLDLEDFMVGDSVSVHIQD